MAQTRKSTRVSIPTTKAKQFQETLRKPILRSISTIDEDENTYNNLNFKKRKTTQDNSKTKAPPKKSNKKTAIADSEEEHGEEEPTFTRGANQNSNNNDEEDFLSYNDEDNLFNSDDDAEYYSAISDYEPETQQSKPSFSYYSKSYLQEKVEKKSLQSFNPFSSSPSSSTHSLLNTLLFDHEETTDASEVSSPIHPSFTFADNVKELKSLEENFQRIIEENEKSQQSSSSDSASNSTTQVSDNNNTSNTALSPSSSSTFIDYLSEDISSDESNTSQNASKPLMANPTSKTPKFLQYRHDERHNLAFPDVSTFPIRFDPSAVTKGNLAAGRKNRVRALKRRAIVTGKAAEMVGIGLGMSTFELDF